MDTNEMPPLLKIREGQRKFTDLTYSLGLDLGADGQPELGGDYRKAFATCQVATFDGRTILLSQGSRALYAYDPPSGDELWRVEERSSYSGWTARQP